MTNPLQPEEGMMGEEPEVAVARAMAEALLESCVHLGECYAVVDKDYCWQEGTWAAGA